MSSVSFSQARDAELAWVDGIIHFSSATPMGVKGQVEEGEEESQIQNLTPVLDAPPHHQVRCLALTHSHTHPHTPLLYLLLCYGQFILTIFPFPFPHTFIPGRGT